MTQWRTLLDRGTILAFTYFNPLRRKIGVVTLAVACVFTVGWVRSGLVEDRISFEAFERRISIVSASGSIECKAPKIDDIWEALKSRRGSTWGRDKGPSYAIETPRIIPYWSIVVPLTPLSAWLLLSKPKIKPALPVPAGKVES